MKRLDLHAALAGAPAQTRDGFRVVVLAHDTSADRKSDKVVWRRLDQRTIHTCDEHGRFYGTEGSRYDLFMIPTKREAWVNLYYSGVATWHKSEDEADTDWYIRKGERIGDAAYRVEYME